MVVRVVIVVQGTANLEEVRASCEAIGLSQITALSELHMLLGSIVAERKDALSSIPGVMSVEEEGDVRIS